MSVERWRDKKGDGPEERAGELFRSVRPPEPSAELEAKVLAVLRGEKEPSRLGRPIPALAGVAVFLLLAGGATAATIAYQTWVAPEEKTTTPPVAKRIVRPPPPVVEVAPPPAVEPPVVEPPPPPKSDPSRLAIESKRIKAAVDALRGGDPSAALQEIASYEEAHPKGLLHREALLAKVSALVALSREADALALLDAQKLDAHPRSLELTLLRGEMRARAKRCEEAIADFERAQASDQEKLKARAEKGLRLCKG